MRKLLCVSLLLLLGGSMMLLRGSPAQAYTVKDIRGKTLNFTAPPRRIITLLPNLTELICDLGLQSRLVGVTSRCDYPPAVRSKPKVGDIYLDYEKVLLLKPDVAIAEQGMRTQQVAKLEKLGIKVAVVNSKNLQGFYHTLNLLGKITGTEAKAQSLEKTFKQTLQSYDRKTSARPPATKPRVFVEIEMLPGLRTIGGGNFINDLVSSAGGCNIFATLPEPYPAVNLESLVRLNPQVIILTTVKPSSLAGKAGWKNLDAVRHNRVYYLNPDLLVRPGMRLLQGLAEMEKCFYPEASGETKR